MSATRDFLWSTNIDYLVAETVSDGQYRTYLVNADGLNTLLLAGPAEYKVGFYTLGFSPNGNIIAFKGPPNILSMTFYNVALGSAYSGINVPPDRSTNQWLPSVGGQRFSYCKIINGDCTLYLIEFLDDGTTDIVGSLLFEHLSETIGTSVGWSSPYLP